MAAKATLEGLPQGRQPLARIRPRAIRRAPPDPASRHQCVEHRLPGLAKDVGGRRGLEASVLEQTLGLPAALLDLRLAVAGEVTQSRIGRDEAGSVPPCWRFSTGC